jgi:tRNA-splicing ligase RtcB (3'-phosphate/5'-hydroxy nucleic acid ligase)
MRELAGVDFAGRPKAGGVQVRAQNKSALAEESSEAYKDVREVVHMLQAAGIANVVAQLRPIGVLKG